jgi:hypothetical protein
MVKTKSNQESEMRKSILSALMFEPVFITGLAMLQKRGLRRCR